MKVLITGAGRMGIRHAEGALASGNVDEVCLTDISESALKNATAVLANHPQQNKLRTALSKNATGNYDIVIIASTASNRIDTCNHALNFNPEYLLIEKPLGQSLTEVEELAIFFSGKKTNVSVNLNMRLYDFAIQLKNDISSLPQFEGKKLINFTGGAIGIGANGIHYLDFLFFILDAESAELASGEIDPGLIPSGRGEQFGDFGGWACVNFFDRNGNDAARSLITMSAASSVFGGWEIIGKHGRIRINELENQRVDILRKPESTMPLNRYAADYLPPVVHTIESPALAELTKKWIDALANEGKNLLPGIADSLKSHKLMFEWLSLAGEKREKFPIT